MPTATEKTTAITMASGEIILEGARAWLVGDAGRGFVQMADMINSSRLSNGMRAAGLMRRAAAEALHTARHRRAFGRRLIDMPLMQALQERHSTRAFRADELPASVVAAILWAGFGVNRPDGKPTAPSAYNVQDIDIYLATEKGLFRYDAGSHSLAPLLPDDLRRAAGR